MSERIAIVTRREAFRQLVEMQDAGGKPNTTKAAIAKRYKLTIYRLEQIIEEGIAKDWPPIGNEPLNIDRRFVQCKQ